MARHRLAIALALAASASAASPGAVTCVIRRGATDRIQATGYRPDTLFQIMSMTKPITAVAIMILADEGRLCLDDRVSNYLPEFAARAYTIRHLFTHTSGLPAEDPKPIWDEHVKYGHTLAEVAALIAAEPPLSAPGAQTRYSGPGFVVLGRVVEMVSQLPFDKFVTDRILTPLGMNDTYFFPPPNVRHRIAPVYEWHDGALHRADVDLYREGAKYANPAGGLFSTAADVARFLKMMLNSGNPILSARAVQEMTAPPGLGWQLRPSGAFGHSGSFGTYMWADPRAGLAGVFLIQQIGATNKERDAFVAETSKQ